jgi:hypothetical protein
MKSLLLNLGIFCLGDASGFWAGVFEMAANYFLAIILQYWAWSFYRLWYFCV